MNSNIKTFFFLGVLLFLALLIGGVIGNEDYEKLITYATICICAYYVFLGWKHSWVLAFILIPLDAFFIHGFRFTALHVITASLLVVLFLSVIYRRVSFPPPQIHTSSPMPIKAILGIFVCFSIFHSGFELANPLNGQEPLLKRSAKVYFGLVAPILALGIAAWGPYTFKLGKNWKFVFFSSLLLALIINIAAQMYRVMNGYGLSKEEFELMHNDVSSLVLPIINIGHNEFALRKLCPFVSIVSSCFLFNKIWFFRQPIKIKIIIFSLLVLSCGGAVTSGGRATSFFCAALVIAIAIYFRRFFIVFTAILGAFLVFAFSNLFPIYINDAPPMISRSLTLLIIDKNDQGKMAGSIESSSNVRYLAFVAALEEWQKGARETLWGRSVLPITPQDALDIRAQGGPNAFIEGALVSGVTHNLITDLLLQFGIIGFTLYLFVYGAIIRFFWNLKNDNKIPEAARVLALAGVAACLFKLMYGLVGGGFIPMEACLLMIVIRFLIHYNVGEVNSSRKLYA